MQILSLPVDVDLYNIVMKAVRDLNDPPDSIAWARRIANRAFEVIWKKELPDGELSSSWAELNRDPIRDRHIPTGGSACRLLQLATGTGNGPRLTKFVSKRTYVLLNFVQCVGDHGQHLLSEDEATWSYATAFCFAAVELCESLARDFDPQ
jgi:hypothetical protein